MKLAPLLTILASVFLTAGAQLSLKLASRNFQHQQADNLGSSLVAQLLDPLTLFALALYVGSTVMWLLALRQVPLSLAFPFSGLTIAVVALLSVGILGESIGWQHAAGIALIMLGVAMLAKTGAA